MGHLKAALAFSALTAFMRRSIIFLKGKQAKKDRFVRSCGCCFAIHKRESYAKSTRSIVWH